MDNIFEKVKQAVSVPQAAQFYGVPVDRSGKCCCMFHRDKHPSMKLNDDYYYCFACHASGDVISFTAKLFRLNKKEAALKLAANFGLEPNASLQQISVKKAARRSEQAEREHAIILLNETISSFRWWKEVYAPKHPEEEMTDEFVTACQCLECFQHLSDMLSFGHPDDAALAMKFIKSKDLIRFMEKNLEVKT